MISIEKAIRIAKKEISEYPVDAVVDLHDKWGVFFDSGDVPAPDIPVITVDKQSGKTGFLTIPPIENLDVLESAKVVWKEQNAN